MKVRIEYEERTRRVIDVEVRSIEEAEATWAEGYGSGTVDEWLAESTKVVGYEDWGSATFTAIEDAYQVIGATK